MSLEIHCSISFLTLAGVHEAGEASSQRG
jgi:hypothetical protein